MPILAIDLGTTNVKAAVVERDGALIGTGRRTVETIHKPGDGAEQDAELVWKAVLGAAEELTKQGDVLRKRVDDILQEIRAA